MSVKRPPALSAEERLARRGPSPVDLLCEWPVGLTADHMVGALRESGMTVTEIAIRCRVSRRSVYNWIAGTPASLGHLSALYALSRRVVLLPDPKEPNERGRS